MYIYVYVYMYVYIVSASRPPPTLRHPELGPQEPRSFRNNLISVYMWFYFLIVQRFTELLLASFGSIRGRGRFLESPWESLGVLS